MSSSTLWDRKIGLSAEFLPGAIQMDPRGFFAEIDDLLHSMHASDTVRRIASLRLDGYSSAEIARTLSVTPHAVRRHLAVARRLLVESGAVELPLRGRDHSTTAHAAASSARYASATTPHPLPCGRLSPRQYYGWQDVYFAEVHRYTPRK
jgi:hypothetical protein